MVRAKNGVARADFGRFDEIRGAALTLDRANRGRILSGHLRRGCGKYNYWAPTHRVDFMLARTRSSFWIR